MRTPEENHGISKRDGHQSSEYSSSMGSRPNPKKPFHPMEDLLEKAFVAYPVI
jgi:hypothetical protein